MKRRSFSESLAALLMGVAFAGCLQASIDRGAIQGIVTDEQGAVVPNAKVVVKNVDTNVAVSLATNGAGVYLAPELVPGKYSVHVEAPGFSPMDITNVTAAAGTTTTSDIRLKVGAVTQLIEVTAAAPLVERTPSNFTTSIDTRYVDEVPLPGRDIQALVQLIPGITQSTGPSGTLFGFDSDFGGFPDPTHLIGSQIAANGGQAGANAWYLDGSLNSVLGAENVVVNPSVDSISEFNIVDNGLAAEWGWTSGAVANVVLKSGTNSVHGDIYEFNRNSYFNATNPFARRDAQGRPFLQPRVNWNNFGGTLGGPVDLPHIYNGKNRTFFFFSYDVSILHENKPTILTVPLPAERQGDFTGDPRFAPVCGVNGATNCLYDPYTTVGPDPKTGQFTRTAFSTPVIPAGRIDPLAAFYLASYPNPNFLDPLQQGPSGCGDVCNNYQGPVGSALRNQNISLKVDHTISEKHKLFAEWLFNPSFYSNFRYPWNGPTAQTQTGLEGAYPYPTINQIYAVGLTSTLTPTLVNEARFMFSRQNQIPRPNPDSVAGTSQVLQHVKGLNFILPLPFVPGPAIYAGSDGGSFGPVGWQNAIQGAEAFTVIDNLTKVLGKHTLKTGMMYRKDRTWYNVGFPYQLSFGGGLTADPVTGLGGSGLAQFLLGAVDQGAYTGTFHAPYNSLSSWSFYGQDDYRVTSSLTLSFGLRWDMFGWFNERHNDVGVFDFNDINPLVPFRGRVNYAGTPQHPDSTLFPANKADFAPRFSFSWSPFGNRKTVIRGGYGMIYSNAAQAVNAPQDSTGSTVGFAQFVFYHGDYTGQRPAFQLSKGAPNLGLPDLSTLKSNLRASQFFGQLIQTDVKIHDPYVQQWSLYVQRELPHDMMLSVGYVGTHGTHLLTDPFRSVDYVSTATRLKLRNNINLPVPVDASLGAIYGCPADPALAGQVDCPGTIVDRPYPEFSPVSALLNSDGYNRYNSFQIKFEKRYAQSLNVIAAYTIQKNVASINPVGLSTASITPTALGRVLGRQSFVRAGNSYVAAGAEDPDNRRRYEALTPDDIPQILNLAAVYNLPFGRGKHFVNRGGNLEKLVGGWKLTQNWNFQRGIPLGFSSPCNAISCRPNLIGNPAAGRGNKSRVQLEQQYFDPSAFQAPFGSDPTVIQEVTTGLNPDGTPLDFNALNQWWVFGNSADRLGNGRSPGFWNSDFTLAKDFHFSESRYFQFRWEVINAFNHQNLSIPNTSWCLPPKPDGSTDAIHVFGCQFGKITGIQTDPRAMEFGLKFFW